jgi:hypothetical protein
MPIQPYRPAPGAEPPAMLGRDGELSAVAASIAMAQAGETPQPIVLTGLRGMGKTALLRRAVRQCKQQGGVVVYIEPSRSASMSGELRRGLERASREAERLSQRIGRAFSHVLAALPEPAYDLPEELGSVSLRARPHRRSSPPLMTALEELNSAVRREGRFLTLAIDELQEGSVRDLTTLVTFVHQTAGSEEPVLLLGAGLPSTPSHLHIVRTYTERWRYFVLRLLTHGDSREAIAKPARELGVRFDPAALERLLVEAGGYPYFLQEYASAAWTARRGRTISLDDVKGVILGVRRSVESALYEPRFRRLTSRECAFVIALAELGEGEHGIGDVADGISVTSEHVSSIRQSLIRKEVLLSPAPGLVEFRIPLSAAYVLRNRGEFEKRMRSRRTFSPLVLRSAAG